MKQPSRSALLVGLTLALLCSSAHAQEDDDWSVELSPSLGLQVFSYEERLGDLDSDYVQPGVALGLDLRGKFDTISPSLRLAAAQFTGDEAFNRTGLDQDNRSDVTTFTGDLDVGYRITLPFLTIIPSLGYTYSAMLFSRSGFVVNGASTAVVDLDGRVLREVDEDLILQGVTGRLVARLDLGTLLCEGHLSYTRVLRVKVVNDVGGTAHSEGDWIRLGGSATYWVAPSFGLVLGVDLFGIALDKSDIEVQGGAAALASVQYPHSLTFAGTLTFGIRARF